MLVIQCTDSHNPAVIHAECTFAAACYCRGDELNSGVLERLRQIVRSDEDARRGPYPHVPGRRPYPVRPAIWVSALWEASSGEDVALSRTAPKGERPS